MKKILFLILALSLVASPAQAFYCQNSMSPGSPEACVTQVKVEASETTIVSQGTVLVYKLDASQTYGGTTVVRAANTSAESVMVAGVSLGSIASGDTGLALVRGFGKVLPLGNLVSGDTLYAATGGTASNAAPAASEDGTVIGFSLETNASGTATAIDAFITIV